MPFLASMLDPNPSGRTRAMSPALGGTLIGAAGAALVVSGLRRRSLAGLVVAAVGGVLAYRGLTGASLAERLVDVRMAAQPRLAIGPRAWSIADDGTLEVRRAVTVARTTDAVDALWSDPAAVAVLSPTIDDSSLEGDRVRWIVRLPGGRTFDATAERVEHRPGEVIAWRIASGVLGGTELRLRQRARGPQRGTEIHGSILVPPTTARAIPRPILGPAHGLELDEILRRTRSLVEVGELATSEGQPTATGGLEAVDEARAEWLAEASGLPDDAVRPRQQVGA
jgi:uncharacterized membrane protein